ncbi:RNA polymerase II transcription factor-like protein B subunit 2 [Massarina eburnea CBS 473.64]|uniref:RNA polymerase II transcription factor B subunit 2 n=1 Tax=Massarina eburnea CBS 473.64 TaxID=1395130 RepID=A0A6A6SAU0_9PLEO|nr:RNA polymerase II transcription factor-like protein B subunit 2 [Massarina eburnea CBS 473.64]
MSVSTSQALDYLEQLPVQTHRKLYEQPSTVLAIFRCMLPHLAKSIVMGMLYMPTPISSPDLDAWFRPSAAKLKRSSLEILEKLHIVSQKQLDAVKHTAFTLSPGFAKSLRQALEGSGTHRSFGVPAPPTSARKVSVAELDDYARIQWESILFYMVGSTVGFHGGGGMARDIGKGTRSLLEAGDFVGKKFGGGVGITRTGFMFVLQDTNAQVWSLLIEYLKHVNQLGMSETDVLSFLFMLGSLELGQDYSTSTLSPTQLQMLIDLTAFGLVYRTSENASTFYPTRLATTLTSDSGALSATNNPHDHAPAPSGGATQKGFIIVETNYRIYAYTSSLLQIAVLSLFCKLTTRFPNLVSGKLTRASISRAVQTGISADQILSYLDSHAHPQMQKSVPFLPPTVTDQIRLWELEGERLECTDGYMLREFPSDKDYRDMVKYAEDLGVLVWKDDGERKFFVNRIEQMQEALKKQGQRRAR